VPPRLYLQALNQAVGSDYKETDWDRLAERMLLMARAYNLREGMKPMRDEVLPLRVHEDALNWGPKKGAVYPLEKFKKERAAWYRIRGCNPRGIPTQKHLRDLGLEFTIEALQKEGLYS